MNTPKRIFTSLLLAAAVCLLTAGACQSTTSQAPPSAAEQHYFKIETNTMEIVKVVTNTVFQTNMVTVTNAQGVAEAAPQLIPIAEVKPVTNYVTSYVMTPNQAAKDTSATIGGVVSSVAGPWGALAGAVSTGFFALWGNIRSRKATTMGNIAANSTQVIETARSILLALPNGAALAAQYDAWMVQHQRDAGIANEVAAIVDKTVDPDHADMVATKLLALVTAPLTPAPAPAARGTSNLG